MRQGLLLAGCLIMLLAPGASAEVLHIGHHHHFFGVVPHRGVPAGQLPGAMVSAPRLSAQASPQASGGDSGALSWQHGPVVHSSAPYLIFWAPNGETIASSTESLLERYFTDVAADSGTSSNIFAVDRQYGDGSGFADYSQSFSAASQALTDTDAYPQRDTTNCPDVSRSYRTCITDTQLEQEISHLIAAQGLPTDGDSTSSLPQNSAIYFVVLPTDVNLCFDGTHGSTSCADNSFCAYHSAYTDPTSQQDVLYAAIPTLILGQNPKTCQSDGNTQVQSPNGGTPAADVVLKYLSHEESETITDPLGTGWLDPTTGNENADECNAYAATANPADNVNPNAFTPTLGGSAASGTLYNQLINGDQYYLQSLWSNGDMTCELQPSSGSISPSFTAPSGSSQQGTSLSFDPSASTSTNSLSSATWNFGDGAATTYHSAAHALDSVSHAYASAGTYTVTLTLVDAHGNLAKTTQQVTITGPTAAFSTTTSTPGSGQATAFDATASSDDAGTISSYTWNFGDGTSPSTVSTATTQHTYAAPGTYTVTLTVQDSDGLTNTATHTVTVAGPSPSFSATAVQEGAATTFDASASTDSQNGVAITSYAWNFGDGTTVSGSTPTTDHTYATHGTYTVTLTLTDASGFSSSLSEPVTVSDEPPTAAFSAPAAGTTTQPVGFDGTASSDSDGTITAYAWSFGDGTYGEGAQPGHLYSTAGTYTVTLTVTDSDGQHSAPVSHQITVHAPPVAAFGLASGQPVERAAAAFTAGASYDPEAGVGIVSYQWNFGDGHTASGLNVSHTYAGAGTYTVTLTTTNSLDLSASTSEQVAVGDDPPSATLLVRTGQPVAGAPVSFDGSRSGEANGAIASYQWSFGDGTSGAGVQPSHVYGAPGTYSVTLTVIDAGGERMSTTTRITVAPAPRITSVKIKRSGSSAVLLVGVSSPGQVRLGRQHVTMRTAGIAHLRLRLTAAQLRQLARHRPVKLHAAISFVPLAGQASVRSVSLALGPGRNSPR